MGGGLPVHMSPLTIKLPHRRSFPSFEAVHHSNLTTGKCLVKSFWLIGTKSGSAEAIRETIARDAKENFQQPNPDNGPRADPDYRGKELIRRSIAHFFGR